MEKVKHLKNLFIYEIQNLYVAEDQVAKALPAMIKKAKHNSLKNALKNYQSITEEHKNRLKEIQKLLIEANKDYINVKTGKAIRGLIEEATMLLDNDFDTEIADAVIIAAAQKMQRYKICSYNIARTYAGKLNAAKERKLLHKLLSEEQDADDLLTQLAQIILRRKTKPADKEPLSEGNKKRAKIKSDSTNDFNEENDDSISSTQNIQSPGGRAGTSHRGYASGESRGH